MKGCSSFLPSPQPPASSLSSAPTPSSLRLLRAFLWNMAGRKESTIGALSSDRQPCCAFSSCCEQALGQQPHKTWRKLTCVQNTWSCLSLKQTGTHAVTIACWSHITRTKKHVFTGLKEMNTRRSFYWYTECIAGVSNSASCEGKGMGGSHFCCLSASKEDGWAAIDLTAWQTALFLLKCYSVGCHWKSMVSQFCYQMAIW